MLMHSNIVTNSWAQCGCSPPFYNKSRNTQTPSHTLKFNRMGEWARPGPI